MNGGDFNTGGFSNSVSSVALNQNSTITFGLGVHTITFSNAGTFTSGKMLTINNWQGTYGSPGSSGTAGKLIISSTLSGSMLSQINFLNASTQVLHGSLQLVSKEIVPGS
jgi:autotransporter translocation and assembly factor TamB